MTVSKAQLRWSQSSAGRRALGASGQAEFRRSAKGKNLPERATKAVTKTVKRAKRRAKAAAKARKAY